MTTSTKDQITAAIGAHGMWKHRLVSAIETGKCEHDASKVERDDQCDFGKWLHGSIDASLKKMPEYAAVRDQHARFHKEAAKILRMALTGQRDAATRALAGDYAAVSAALVQLLRDWKTK